MIKVLFFIHDLGQGGAEKVLINLVNNMNSSMFDITVISLFGGGVNEKFLHHNIKYKSILPREIPGNSKLMKIFTPEFLHKICVREKYDIEVAYLEGPSSRIISGCRDESTKLVSWIHVEQHNQEKFKKSFRSYSEAISSYLKFNEVVCVSNNVKTDFLNFFTGNRSACVLYNTVESETIRKLAVERVSVNDNDCFRMIAVGTLKESKGYNRLFRIMERLIAEGYAIHLDVLGVGPQKEELENYIAQNNLSSIISLLGYDTNPYKYLAVSDLFVCASFAEGFSTAATEALIVGIPVCTVEVSGMKEMLGYNNEYGIITENSEEGLYQGIKYLLDNKDKYRLYKEKAVERGKLFDTKSTVAAVEKMLSELVCVK